MDQPGNEIAYLEQILGAYSRWEDLQQKRQATRSKNRQRHAPQPQGTK